MDEFICFKYYSDTKLLKVLSDNMNRNILF